MNDTGSFENMYLILLIFVVSFFSFVLSIITLCYLKYVRKHRQASSFSIINLLFINIIQALITLPCFALKYSTENYRKTFRDPFLFTYLVTTHACSFSLLLMSADRVISLRKPLIYTKIITKKFVLVSILLIWLILVVIDSIPFFNETAQNSLYYYNPSSIWTIAVIVLFTLIPVILLICCWLYIVQVALHHHRKLSRWCQGTSKRRVRASKVTVSLITVYVLCFGPSSFYYTLEHACPRQCFPTDFIGSSLDKDITFYLKLLSLLFMLLPPVILCWNKHFVNYLKVKLIPDQVHRKFSSRLSVVSKGKC